MVEWLGLFGYGAEGRGFESRLWSTAQKEITSGTD